MLQLKKNPTLKDYHVYIAEMIKERGFDMESVPQLFMLLMEECGEFAKAARKSQGIHIDSSSEKYDLGHEAADIFTYLLDICNHYNIDLEEAFRSKEEINSNRNWTK